MTGPVRSFIPHAFVRDVSESIGFYGKLGFKVANSFTPENGDQPQWCLLSSERGELMLGTARQELVPEQQGVLFYGYCDNVAATHADLSAAGLPVGPITAPFYNPGGEFRLQDPDGYVIWIAQI